MDNSSNTKEFSIIKCKGCGEEKKRILFGRYPNSKDKRWVDDTGREFNGRMCPSCNSRKKAQQQKNKRQLIKTSKELGVHE